MDGWLLVCMCVHWYVSVRCTSTCICVEFVWSCSGVDLLWVCLWVMMLPFFYIASNSFPISLPPERRDYIFWGKSYAFCNWGKVIVVPLSSCATILFVLWRWKPGEPGLWNHVQLARQNRGRNMHRCILLPAHEKYLVLLTRAYFKERQVGNWHLQGGKS